ncbi:MAG: pantoate--beta-alanine ligase [Bacteroidota bacterium]|nr:pantoate--beta-alanine ligase [Bacteroidota bacterium]
MLIFRNKKKLQTYLNEIPRNENIIGFVPTMGSLHEGHLQLIKESTKECTITICSIFINPTQFNNEEDLKNYPRNTEKDINILNKTTDCNIVYYPEISDLYKKNEKAHYYNFNGLDKSMEGIYRPNHFNGVATVLEKFFRIINPNIAFFGEKDLQQLQIVKKLVTLLNMPIKIVGVPTKRDKNGIAMSSRNNFLNNHQIQEALQLYASLQYCKDNKTNTIKTLRSHIISKFEKNAMIKLEYIEFVDFETLRPIKKIKPSPCKNAICIAAYIGDVRLIDNIIL